MTDKTEQKDTLEKVLDGVMVLLLTITFGSLLIVITIEVYLGVPTLIDQLVEYATKILSRSISQNELNDLSEDLAIVAAFGFIGTVLFGILASPVVLDD